MRARTACWVNCTGEGVFVAAAAGSAVAVGSAGWGVAVGGLVGAVSAVAVTSTSVTTGTVTMTVCGSLVQAVRSRRLKRVMMKIVERFIKFILMVYDIYLQVESISYGRDSGQGE
jgi:hypothetical protein